VSEQESKPLESMTKEQLRAYAEAHGIAITYAAQRRQPDLVKLIRAGLAERESGDA
jgi:hypothetical protein